MRGKQDHSRQHGLRRNQTEAELRLWQYLRNRRLLGWKFRRQHRLGPYLADFVCLQAKLVVELDGSRHLDLGQAGHDRMRSEFLCRRGYRILRLWNDDVFLRVDSVLDRIATSVGAPHPPSAPSPRMRGEGKAVVVSGEKNA